MAIGGFANMKALSERNDRPETASRPVRRDARRLRDGRGRRRRRSSRSSSTRRRAARRIYAEIVGYGATGDAYHLTAPAPDGEGAQRAMRGALKDAGLDAGRRRSTSTPTARRRRRNDSNETQGDQGGLRRARAKTLNVSSTKSTTGHMLGAAGAVEFIVCALVDARRHRSRRRSTTRRRIPSATSTTRRTAPAQREVRAALSNSFGFGGHNVTLAVQRFED